MTPGNGRQGFQSGPGSQKRKSLKAPQVGLLLILGARFHLFLVAGPEELW